MRRCFDSLSDKTIKIIYDKYVEEKNKYGREEPISFEVFLEDPDQCDWVEYLMYALEERGFEYSYGPDGGDMMFGISPEKMPEDMTLKEFKDSIEKKLEDVGMSGSVYLISEGWYDG